MIKYNISDPWDVDIVPYLDIQAYTGDKYLWSEGK